MNKRARTNAGAALCCAAFAFGPAPALAAGLDSHVDAVSIYPRGAAVVAQSKRVALHKGRNTIDWPVAGPIQPATLWLAGRGVRLAGFSAWSAPKRADHPLAARIGKTVTLVPRGALGRGADGKTKQARLVDVAGDDAFVELDGRVVRLTPDAPWLLRWPAAEFRTRAPRLVLDVRAAQPGARRLRAVYQRDGLAWRASTTARFDAESHRLTYRSTAIIQNQSGAALDAGKAWLVAGAIARAGGARPVAARAVAKDAAGAGAPQAVGHGYRYPLAGGLQIAAGATRAAAIVARTTVAAERRFTLSHRFNEQSSAHARAHAGVRLAFKNSSDAPLPAGAFRVYDAERAATLLGSARIANTPAGAPVALTLGRAFEITGTRRIVADSRTPAGANRRTVAVTVFNAGDSDARVELTERLPRHAQITSASTPPAKTSAGRARWSLDVAASDRREIRYRVTWPHKPSQRRRNAAKTAASR